MIGWPLTTNRGAKKESLGIYIKHLTQTLNLPIDSTIGTIL